MQLTQCLGKPALYHELSGIMIENDSVKARDKTFDKHIEPWLSRFVDCVYLAETAGVLFNVLGRLVTA